MGRSWALSLAVAALCTLTVTPPLRRLALATGVVDRPAAGRAHGPATPCLGGIGLVVSVLLAVLVTWPDAATRRAVVLGATLVGLVGLVDDARGLRPRTRLLAELVPAAMAIAVGLRIDATGLTPVDVTVSLIWIVGVTNAVNFLDNMDGLASGVSAVAATAILGLAVSGGRAGLAVLAAAAVGASTAFLVYNRRPASIFMGDAGSLFLGYLLAVTALDVEARLEGLDGLVVPLLLCAVPVVDIAVVTVARLRHGRSVVVGGQDHLSHRLVRSGMSSARTVLILVGAQAVGGAAAVLAARRALPLSAAVLLAGAPLAVLVASPGGSRCTRSPSWGCGDSWRDSSSGAAGKDPNDVARGLERPWRRPR